MATITGTPRFTIGRTLGDSLRIFGRNLIAFALLALAIRLLLLLVPQDQATAAMTMAGRIDWFTATVSMAVTIVVLSATKAAMVFPTMQNLRGQRSVLSDLWKCIPFLPAIIAAEAIFTLPSIVSLAAKVLFAGNAVATGLVGFIAGIVGLALLLMWWLYPPAIAIEKGGILHGLKRSNDLLRGQRWRVFGLLVVLGIISAAVVFAIALAGGLSLGNIALLAAVTPTSPMGIAMFIFSALVSAFSGVLITVSYYHLRLEKEGAIAEDLAQVFE
jgi:hypothetical protein